MTRKLKADELSEFCRQLGALTRAGIPVAKAVEILKTATENKRISKIYGELETMIRCGRSIADSMEALHVFPELTVSMFRAAEASGQLKKTANRLAEHYRKEYRLENQIKTATLYPKLLCIMMLGMIVFVFLGIIPMVEPLFAEMELPLETKILIKISSFLKESWYLAVPVAVFAVLLGKILKSNWRIRTVIDMVYLHLPVIGNYLRILYTERFARSQSGLYSSGVSIVDSLSIAAGTIGSHYLEAQFRRVVEDVKNGDPLSHAIEQVKGLDKKLSMIIRVGEETGELDAMLESIAEGYEHEAEMILSRVIRMMEPMLLIVIGLVIIEIFRGIMVPMWSMYEYIG